MNSNKTEFLGGVVGNKSNKKLKRKRRKNKYKNSSFGGKKNHKKFHPPVFTNPGFSKPRKSSYSDNSSSFSNKKIMSNWYWSNYRKAFEWQNKHKIAHWKACALALQEENRYLMHIINQMQPGMCSKLNVTSQDLSNRSLRKFRREENSKGFVRHIQTEVSDDEDSDENEFKFEMSEEMIKFFEQSFKHKMDLKKQKEERECQSAENEIKQIQSNRIKRSEEMQLLYGEGASMIIGMETAVQLSYEKYCDTKSPKFWPNIPLKL